MLASSCVGHPEALPFPSVGKYYQEEVTMTTTPTVTRTVADHDATFQAVEF
jgi:hypothetical protein